jgi:iron uptake system component EfeO
MNQRTTRLGLLVVTGAAALLALTACVPNSTTASSASSTTKLTVDSSATDCAVSAETAPSGTVAFTVTNSTDKVTEFYLLGADGLRVVGEIENVTPGVKRNLTVQLQPGNYFTVCKPGMIGDGIGRTAFTVTDSGTSVELTGNINNQTKLAAKNYVAYIKDQVAQLVPANQEFLAAYLAGDDAKARSLYASTRAYY